MCKRLYSGGVLAWRRRPSTSHQQFWREGNDVFIRALLFTHGAPTSLSLAQQRRCGLSNSSRHTPSWSSSTVASFFWGSTVTVLVVSAIVGLICLEFVAFFEERNLRADREFSAAQEEA